MRKDSTGCRVLLCIVGTLLMCCLTAKAQTNAKADGERTHTVFFRVGKSNFDPMFRNNAAVMSNIIGQLDSLNLVKGKEIKSIKISTSTSPEGGRKLNVNLASARSRSIVRYLESLYPELTQQVVISSELAPDWNMLERQVENGYMPQREEALDILRKHHHYYNPDLTVVDPRETLLRQLKKGKVWTYMNERYFPDMRYAKVELLNYLIDTDGDDRMEEVLASKLPAESPFPSETMYMVPAEKPKSDRHFIMAIKSNLLFDLGGAFNGEIEVPLGRHWSAQAEVVWPWYVGKHDSWCYQLGMGTGEIRRWLGSRPAGNPVDPSGRYNPLTGHFIGLTGGGGYYDVENKNDGFQGEFWMAGLTYGYSMKLSRHFNMEFSLGVGYVHTKSRGYDAVRTEDGVKHLARQYYDRKNWVGPVKAKISLSWLLFNKKK